MGQPVRQHDPRRRFKSAGLTSLGKNNRRLKILKFPCCNQISEDMKRLHVRGLMHISGVKPVEKSGMTRLDIMRYAATRNPGEGTR